MNEREFERERSRTGDANSTAIPPGRASASANLTSPESPIPSGILMRAAERDDHGVAPDAEQRVAQASSSTGMSLPGDLQNKFESSLGTSLASVRIHTGAESATAAQAVGAKAYTIGQDIHFSAGRYDPSSRTGQSLLAHEVAHTVQQAGGAARRQNKLEVSSSGDSAELEADAAAEAMVEGRAAAVSGASAIAHRSTLFRDEEDDKEKTGDADDSKQNAANTAWAEAARPGIQDVVDTTASAIERVNEDAELAITAIEKAQTSYTSYEKKYAAALNNFKSGVEAAQKASKELEDAVKIVGNVALGAAFPLLAATKGAIGGVLEQVSNAATVAGVVGLVPPAKGAPAESDKAMGPSGKVDWKALLQTTISSFKTYLQQNKMLATIAKEAGAAERYLAEVIEGKHDGTDAANSDQGIKTDDMATNHMTIGLDLDGIAGNEVSDPADEFAVSASTSLDGLSAHKIEQDIAIKWMSGLTAKQRDEIDGADDYLKRLGLIDKKGSRLDYDTGGWTNDGDEVMIHLRAQIEQAALEAVGNAGEWLGGNAGAGRVKDCNGISWPAFSAETIPDAAGGPVLLMSYKFNGTQDIGNDMGRPRTEALAKSMMINRCVFAIKPTGKMGGGVHEGPELRPAKPK